ncbi:MAG TPA: hypothetical protein VF593_01080, partial [Chthoniobacteraceae bacterium]
MPLILRSVKRAIMSEHPLLASFRSKFEALTGKLPFPWQEELFSRFANGEIPECCDLPTGLG